MRSVLLSAVMTAVLSGAGTDIRDLDGVLFNPLAPGGRASVLLFVSSDCPVSNRYAPEIQRLCRHYQARGVSCSLVYEDLRIDARGAKQHLGEYGYRGIRGAIDADRRLATGVGATVTPEAVVIDRAGAVRYRGRIDNGYASLGVARQVVTSHDLGDAIDAVLAGRTVARPETQAIGCSIPPAAISK